MSLKIDEVVSVLRSNQIPASNISKIVAELKDREESKKSVSAGPKSKKQYVFLASSSTSTAAAGFVVQIDESEDANTTVDKVRAAARAYNGSRKGSKTPVSSVAETLSLPRKFLVDSGIWVKTKEPVRLLDLPTGL